MKNKNKFCDIVSFDYDMTSDHLKIIYIDTYT